MDPERPTDDEMKEVIKGKLQERRIPLYQLELCIGGIRDSGQWGLVKLLIRRNANREQWDGLLLPVLERGSGEEPKV